jgi:hypothetical protein
MTRASYILEVSISLDTMPFLHREREETRMRSVRPVCCHIAITHVLDDGYNDRCNSLAGFLVLNGPIMLLVC